MNIQYFLCGLLIQVIGFIFMIIVMVKQRSIKKGLQTYGAYQKYAKGGNEMKRSELMAQLLAYGVSKESAEKMLNVVDSAIEVKAVYNGIDREQLYQAGQLLKIRKSGVDTYYQFEEQVK